MTSRDIQRALRIANNQPEPLSWWVWVVVLIIVAMVGQVVK